MKSNTFYFVLIKRYFIRVLSCVKYSLNNYHLCMYAIKYFKIFA